MTGGAGQPRRIVCVYHGNCADGFTAAWVFARFASGQGLAVEYVPAFHGAGLPDVTGAEVVMLDFSYKRSALLDLAERAHSILILDHHKTAAEDLAGFPAPGEDHLGGNIAVVFDMDRSGAQIAWDHFFPGAVARPVLVDYVGDRDLWRFDLPDSRAVSAAVFSYPYDFDVWDDLVGAMEGCRARAGIVAAGEAIERKHHKDIAELVRVTRRDMVIAGRRVPVANLPYTMASDAAHLLAEGHPFAACYFDRGDGQRVFSLRSREGGADVAVVAALYGGGGHKHAAGFQRPWGWCGDDCYPEASGLSDSLARALGECLRWRNWQLAEGGVTPPDLRDTWRNAERALKQWSGINA